MKLNAYDLDSLNKYRGEEVGDLCVCGRKVKFMFEVIFSPFLGKCR